MIWNNVCQIEYVCLMGNVKQERDNKPPLKKRKKWYPRNLVNVALCLSCMQNDIWYLSYVLSWSSSMSSIMTLVPHRVLTCPPLSQPVNYGTSTYQHACSACYSLTFLYLEHYQAIECAICSTRDIIKLYKTLKLYWRARI